MVLRFGHSLLELTFQEAEHVKDKRSLQDYRNEKSVPGDAFLQFEKELFHNGTFQLFNSVFFQLANSFCRDAVFVCQLLQC